jgi:hypothetical protein
MPPTPATPATARTAKPRPQKYRVRKVTAGTDITNAPVLFSSESKALAEGYLKRNHPRGREAVLQTPTGDVFHYSADHENQGENPWFEYTTDEDEDD